MTAESNHKVRTLCLAAGLHAFTHIYQVALMPLYLLIQRDFQLVSVGKATLMMTVMMVSYFAPSYPMGMLADRVSRKKLLGFGLAINALGFVGLSQAPNYATALVCIVVAGFGGSFFHPAATAMIARLFPIGTGRALGFLGIGASVGFFIGPIYSGWRAETAGWRRPVLELGILGIIGAIVFLCLAKEELETEGKRTGTSAPAERMFPTPALWLFFIVACFALGLRDFTGMSMGSLGSLFLQKAHRFSPKYTGLALSAIFLASAISNPLFGGLSDRGRIRWTSFVLGVAGIMVAIFPHLPRSLLIPGFVVYGFFFMASYPTIEAALMESVPDAVRGRVFGFFITIGGLIGNLSHWIVGGWVQRLGDTAHSAANFYPMYTLLACFLFLSLAGLPCLHAIRKREGLQAHPTRPAVASTAGNASSAIT